MAAMDRPIRDAEFAVLDLATTGLEPDWGHRVCGVGLIVLSGGEEIERYSTLVDPGRTIDSSAAAANRLSTEMLREAPPPREVLPRLGALLANRVLVAYNASFELGFLRNEFRLADAEPPHLEAISVIALARRLLPELGRYPLDRVAERLGIAWDPAQGPLAAAEATARIFWHFASRLVEHGISSVGQLEEITRPTSLLAEALRRDKLRLLQEAISTGRKVHLIYRARSEALTERDVSPLEVRTDAGKAQLVGFCHLRDAERTFNVDAIQDVEVV